MTVAVSFSRHDTGDACEPVTAVTTGITTEGFSSWVLHASIITHGNDGDWVVLPSIMIVVFGIRCDSRDYWNGIG